MAVEEEGCVYLPEEIIFDHILIRLPAEVVVRFKWVCKRWFKYICSPRFKNIHFNTWRRFPSGKIGIRYPSPRRLPFSAKFPSKFIQEDERFRVMDSCDGLILLGVYKNSRHVSSITSYCVLNPVIGYFTKLPPTPGPCWSAILFLDDTVNQYKVMTLENVPDISMVHILDNVVGDNIGSSSSSWRTVYLSDSIGYSSCVANIPVALKGCLYWYLMFERVVMSLDITSGDIQRIELPHIDYGYREPRTFWSFTLLPIKGVLYGFDFDNHCVFYPKGYEYCHVIWVLSNQEWIEMDIKKSTNCQVCKASSSFYSGSDSDFDSDISALLLEENKIDNIESIRNHVIPLTRKILHSPRKSHFHSLLSLGE